MIAKDSIELNCKLGGGSMIMLGTFNLCIVCIISDLDTMKYLSCDTSVFGDRVDDQCDTDAKVPFRFHHGGTADATASLRGTHLWKCSKGRVTLKEIVVPGKNLPATKEKLRTLSGTLHGSIQAFN